LSRPKKKVEIVSEFTDVKFPVSVLCVAQPVRSDIWEGEQYKAVDRYKFNDIWYIVVLDQRGRELYFKEEYFVLV